MFGPLLLCMISNTLATRAREGRRVVASVEVGVWRKYFPSWGLILGAAAEAPLGVLRPCGVGRPARQSAMGLAVAATRTRGRPPWRRVTGPRSTRRRGFCGSRPALGTLGRSAVGMQKRRRTAEHRSQSEAEPAARHPPQVELFHAQPWELRTRYTCCIWVWNVVWSPDTLHCTYLLEKDGEGVENNKRCAAEHPMLTTTQARCGASPGPRDSVFIQRDDGRAQATYCTTAATVTGN